MTGGRWSIFCSGVDAAHDFQIYDAVKILVARKNGGLVTPGETDSVIRSCLVRYKCKEDDSGKLLGHYVDLIDHSGKPVFAPYKEKQKRGGKNGYTD